jgi:hypothetical protein
MSRHLTVMVLLLASAFVDRTFHARAAGAINRPPILQAQLTSPQFSQRFIVLSRLHPAFLSGDFDGDGKADYAVMVQNREDRKSGIAIYHPATGHLVVLGAGREFGNGGDDFSWIDRWTVYPKSKVARGLGQKNPPALKGQAVWVEKKRRRERIDLLDRENLCLVSAGRLAPLFSDEKTSVRLAVLARRVSDNCRRSFACYAL